MTLLGKTIHSHYLVISLHSSKQQRTLIGLLVQFGGKRMLEMLRELKSMIYNQAWSFLALNINQHRGFCSFPKALSIGICPQSQRYSMFHNISKCNPRICHMNYAQNIHGPTNLLLRAQIIMCLYTLNVPQQGHFCPNETCWKQCLKAFLGIIGCVSNIDQLHVDVFCFVFF